MTDTQLPDAASLAVALAERGVPVVVVGSTARWLTDPAAPMPRDLDVLLEPTDAALARFGEVVAQLDVHSRTRWPRRGDELLEWEPWQLRTKLGALDVFAVRYPEEESRMVDVCGVSVRVVARTS